MTNIINKTPSPLLKKRRKNSLESKQRKYGYIFLAPFILGAGLFVVVPLIMAVCFSFGDVGLNAKQNGIKFVDLDNALYTADAWAFDNIKSAVEKGFVPEDIQNDYTQVITRAEFCRMAVKFVEYATGKSIGDILKEKGLTRDYNAFSDTDDPDILAAYALGITNGTQAPTADRPASQLRTQAH